MEIWNTNGLCFALFRITATGYMHVVFAPIADYELDVLLHFVNLILFTLLLVHLVLLILRISPCHSPWLRFTI